MPQPIRLRNATLAVKPEATPGVDAFGGAAPSAANDFLKADVQVTFNQDQNANPELTYALEIAAPIPGGTKAQIVVTCMMKGSGAPGVPPQWGKLMKLCAFQEIITAAGIAAQAATAGSANSATLGANYAANAGAYQGMPVILTGNPAGPFQSIVTSYSASKLALLAHTFVTPLDNTTLVALPANTLYRPVSDPALISGGTLNVYTDGLLWKFTGCSGTWTADMPAGKPGTLKFTITGQYNAPVAAVPPAGLVFDAVTPPVFRQGIARLGGALVRVSRASFDAGNKLYEPENPEATEGFDPSVITSREAKGSMDPLSNVADTIARMAMFKAGGQQSVAASLGAIPGNIVSISSPAVQFTGQGPTARGELMAENIPFTAPTPNASLFVAAS